MRPMGEGLDVKFGGFGIYLAHTFRRREKEVFGTHSLYRVTYVLGLIGDQAER